MGENKGSISKVNPDIIAQFLAAWGGVEVVLHGHLTGTPSRRHTDLLIQSQLTDEPTSRLVKLPVVKSTR